MNQKTINNQNIIIKYRNYQLKARGINPKIYFLALNYFYTKYHFFRDNIVYKKTINSYYKMKGISDQSVMIEFKNTFGVTNEVASKILREIFYDKELHMILSEKSIENWDLLTVPYTDEEIDDFPF